MKRYLIHLIVTHISIVLLMCGCATSPEGNKVILEQEAIQLTGIQGPFYLENRGFTVISFKNQEVPTSVVFDSGFNVLNRIEYTGFVPVSVYRDTLLLSNLGYNKFRKLYILDSSISYKTTKTGLPALVDHGEVLLAFGDGISVIARNGIIVAYNGDHKLWENANYSENSYRFCSIVGNYLYLQLDHESVLFQLDSGKPLYVIQNERIPGLSKFSPQILQFLSERLLISYSPNNSLLYCFDLQDNKLNWVKKQEYYLFQLGALPLTLPYLNAVVDGQLVWIDHKYLFLKDIYTGEEHEVYLKGAAIHNYFVKNNNQICLLDKTSTLHVFNLKELKSTSVLKL